MPLDLNQISKDIKRTSVPKDHPQQYLPQYYSSVENILIAFSNANPRTGYMQGMNMIAASVLFNVVSKDYQNIEKHEEDAFRIFYSLMERYKAKEFFTNSMNRTLKITQKLENLLASKDPELLSHIKTEKVK